MTYNLPLALRTAYFIMHRATNTALRPYAITADQFVCLDIVIRKPLISQKELSELATSDPNTISAIVRLLEKKGLITKEPQKSDKRAFSLSASEAGIRLHQQLDTVLKPVREKLRNQFKEVEYEQFHTYLDRISAELLNL